MPARARWSRRLLVGVATLVVLSLVIACIISWPWLRAERAAVEISRRVEADVGVDWEAELVRLAGFERAWRRLDRLLEGRDDVLCDPAHRVVITPSDVFIATDDGEVIRIGISRGSYGSARVDAVRWSRVGFAELHDAQDGEWYGFEVASVIEVLQYLDDDPMTQLLIEPARSSELRVRAVAPPATR